MPRAIWTGAITFGLVNVPVRIYSAISEHKLHFNLIHKKDDSPIGYQKICKKEDKPVPDKEIVKAFEYRKGEFVYMEDEDFEAAKVEGYKTIDVTAFVPYSDIDPIFFAKTYYVGPQEGAERVYSLFVKAMADSELAAIAKFVMRDRQYLGALRVREGTITLEQLYFADEIRPVEEIKPAKAQVDKRELQMAAQLIESFSGEWRPEKYKDTYRDSLCEVIEAKRKGKEVHVAPEVEEEAPVDLMAALRASIDAAKKGGRRPARSGRAARGKKAARKAA
jgi:DNA end-binding protein Ku